jgi:integrase
MAREMKRLTARAVATLTKHGRHGDGGGLYLSISPNGGKRWTFLYRWHKKPTEIGLGSARPGHVTLAQARAMATTERAKLAERPPRNPKDKPKPVESATFGEVADKWIEDHRSKWRSAKSEQAWTMTLGNYCVAIRRYPVADLKTEHILEVLKPLWETRPETAARLRGRIEQILDAAKAKGLRFGENPARWKGHLKELLPKRSKNSRRHHAAMPYDDLPGFVVALRAREGIPARALEFAILTAARTGEVIGATWSEIDLGREVWTIPAGRMKAGVEHRVPLSARAVAILREIEGERIEGEAFVFPGQRQAGRALGDRALQVELIRMKVDGAATVHGMRSTFRDWCGNETSYPREVCETALAHAIGDKSERAYRRSDALEKRRQLMTAWSEYCGGSPAGNVVQFTGRATA